MKILHFADAHIDIATQGRHDPESGLAVRTLDFLKVPGYDRGRGDREKVDLVHFRRRRL